MANRHRCEVAFPDTGEGHFIRFTLADLAVLEDQYGTSFFDDIEKGCAQQSPNVILNCLKVGLKEKGSSDADVPVYSKLDLDQLQEDGFTIGCAARPVLEALSLSWLGKDYRQLVDEAKAARLQEEEQKAKQAKQAVKEAAEVAKEAGVPFDAQASLKLLLNTLTDAQSAPEPSGI